MLFEDDNYSQTLYVSYHETDFDFYDRIMHVDYCRGANAGRKQENL